MLPREKLINNGVSTLEDYELLAIILGSANRGENVFMLAKRIISEIGLNDLIDISYQELTQIKGIKCAKATKLIASLELAKRIFSYDKKGIKLDNPEAIYHNVKFDFLGKRQEILLIIYLDKKMNLLMKKVMSLGSNDSLMVDQMEILRQAIKLSSPYIVMAHNHPSGTLYPSKQDILTTKIFASAAKGIGITLIDHLIITKSGYYSFLMEHKLE